MATKLTLFRQPKWMALTVVHLQQLDVRHCCVCLDGRFGAMLLKCCRKLCVARTAGRTIGIDCFCAYGGLLVPPFVSFMVFFFLL